MDNWRYDLSLFLHSLLSTELIDFLITCDRQWCRCARRRTRVRTAGTVSTWPMRKSWWTSEWRMVASHVGSSSASTRSAAASVAMASPDSSVNTASPLVLSTYFEVACRYFRLSAPAVFIRKQSCICHKLRRWPSARNWRPMHDV